MSNNQNSEGTGETPLKPATPLPSSQLKIPPKTPNPPAHIEIKVEGRTRLEAHRDSNDVSE
jgi:hypothetical protein